MGKSNLDGLNVEEEVDPDEEAPEHEDDLDAPGDDEDRGDAVNPEDADTEGLKKLAGGEEEEEEEVEEEEDAGKKKPAQPVVSHGRFHEVNEALKSERAARLRLEEELARARGSAPAPQKQEPSRPTFDVDAKEEEYANALIEGDTKKAAAIRKEINAELTRVAREEAEANAASAYQQAAQKSAFNKAVVETIAKYPFLNSEGEEADSEAIDEVIALRDFYHTKKDMPLDEALRKAAERVAKTREAPKPDEEEPDETEAGEGQQQEQRKPAAVKKPSIAELRKAQALRRNAEAAKQQPASMGAGTGNRSESSKIDPEAMDEEAFEKLSEKEKAKLRGDDM